MKNAIIIAMILICSSLVFAIGPSDYSSGLIHHWKGDGDATDSVGSNHGSFAANTYTDGRDGQAFSLDGVDDLMGLSNVAGHTDFTASLWIKPDSTSYMTLLQLDDMGFQTLADGRLYYYSWDSRAGGTGNVRSNAYVANYTTDWLHVTIVGQSTSVLKLYLNGNLAESSFGSGNPSHTYFDDLIGATKSTTGAYNAYFNGTIDDIAIWNRALSSTEIEGLYNSYPAESEAIPEVSGSKAMQIFVVLIVALLVGALVLRNK